MSEKMSDTQKFNMLGQRELMMATQLAKARDDFQWLCALHGTLGSLLVIGAAKTHNPRLLVPLVPMSFSLAYLHDVASGKKFERMRVGAEEILAKERSLFQVPEGNRMMNPEDYDWHIVRGMKKPKA